MIKRRFFRFLMAVVILLSFISVIILSSALFFYFSHRLEVEFTQKMSSQRGELELLLKNRLDGLNDRLRELSLNNTIRVTMMLGVASQLDEQLQEIYPASDGTCFFIRDGQTSTIYPETHSAGISNRLIDLVLSSPPQGTLIQDDGRKRFLYLFSSPIMRRTERLGTAFCLYDMLADRKFIETIHRTVDGDVFFLARDGSRHSIRGTILLDKPGMYAAAGPGYFKKLYHAYSLENLKEQKIGFLFIIACVSVLVLALSALIAIVLIRRIAKPMTDMTGRAIRISKGERDVIFDEEESDYIEFNQLSGAFNFMLKSLREAEERSRYEELFENVADCVWITDLEGNILDANQECRRVHGRSREAVLGMNLSSIMSGEGTAAILDPARRKEGKTLDLLFSAADGTMIPMEVNTKGITYMGKETVLCVARDITDRKNAEEELKKHREHLKLINQILRHDTLNDLTAVKSALRLYESSNDEEFLKEASRYVDRGAGTIKRMRELESIISSHRDLEFYDIKDVIRKVIENYGSIEFTIEGKGQVLANGAIDSVIDNIISNAVVHGKTDRIDITIDKQKDLCEVRIADYGIGIPDDIKEKIFGESFTYGETGHTGLGLYIVKKTMENYGGSVYVEDNTPQGVVFVLRLRRLR